MEDDHDGNSAGSEPVVIVGLNDRMIEFYQMDYFFSFVFVPCGGFLVASYTQRMVFFSLFPLAIGSFLFRLVDLDTADLPVYWS